MRKILQIACLLVLTTFCTAAFAQLIMMTGSGGTNPPPSSYTGPIDVVASPYLCYSLMACSSAIASGGTTAAVNIQRASDSHRCDVIATSGVLTGLTTNCGTGGDNGQSVSSFCASTTCTNYEWYDQSGNGNHMTQTDWLSWRGPPPLTANASPDGSHYALACAGTGNCGGQIAFTAPSAPYTVSLVINYAASATNNSFVAISAGLARHSGSNVLATYCSQISGQLITATAADGSFHAVQHVFAEGSGAGAVVPDGVATTGTFSAGNCSGSTSGLTIGNSDNTALSFEEVILYTSGFNSTQWTSMNSNQHTRFGF